jgi:hypothetical protein
MSIPSSIHRSTLSQRNRHSCLLSLVVVVLAACQVLDAGGVADSGSPATGMVDAGGGSATGYPNWKLLELRSGETKGLDAFAGRPLVVTLLEGF